jgi:hypothetical protein
MELRRIVAYTLLALVVLTVAALAAWWRYNSHDRALKRRHRRENEVYERRMDARDSGDE